MVTIQTPTSTFPWRPDVSAFAASDIVPDALVMQCSTIAGEIQGDAPSVRVAYVQDDDAQHSAEAEEIPEAQPGLSEVQVFTTKITQLIRVSREQYNQTGTAEQLSMSARRAIIRKADTSFIAEPPPPRRMFSPLQGCSTSRASSRPPMTSSTTSTR